MSNARNLANLLTPTTAGTIPTDLVMSGTTPTLTIGDAGAEDTAIIFDGNAQDFHIGLDDPILNDEWILNPIGEHGEGGDPDLDFSGKLDKEGLWLTSIDSSEGYLDYIDSFENIVKRIEDGSLAKVLKFKTRKEESQ